MTPAFLCSNDLQGGQFPYCALTPKASECTNMVGLGALDYTHVARCKLRLGSVWVINGQAAGIAAAKDENDFQKVKK